MALLTCPHRERAPPRRFMERIRFPLRSAMLRKDKYTQVTNPRPWNRTVLMSYTCEACAGVPACVYGPANAPACEPCWQAIEARPRAPPLADKQDACSAPNDIGDSPPPRGRPPLTASNMKRLPLPCAMLRTNIICADYEPQALEQDGVMSSAWEVCAGALACVCGRASVPVCAPCRQTWRHAGALPPLAVK